MGGRGRVTDPGSDKQRTYAELVVSGEKRTMVAAYESVYGSGGSRKTRVNEASRLWRSPYCQTVAEGARRRLDAERRRKLAGERDAVRNRLWGIADASEARDSDRLTALRMLGSQTGVEMFSEAHTITQGPQTGTDAELISELEILLRNALGVN